MTELYTEHLVVGDTIQHERIEQMKELDRNPEYTDITIEPSDNSAQMYLVGRVAVLTKPFAKADVSEDTTEVIACACDDWWYNRTKGFENGEMEVTEITPCKHGRRAFREIKAEEDDQQETLR